MNQSINLVFLSFSASIINRLSLWLFHFLLGRASYSRQLQGLESPLVSTLTRFPVEKGSGSTREVEPFFSYEFMRQ
ncbi:hypothetical protein J3F84DRAFT_388503 [Trichoderma pleuroticola]